jgi:hypothetical protein
MMSSLKRTKKIDLGNSPKRRDPKFPDGGTTARRHFDS